MSTSHLALGWGSDPAAVVAPGADSFRDWLHVREPTLATRRPNGGVISITSASSSGERGRIGYFFYCSSSSMESVLRSTAFEGIGWSAQSQRGDGQQQRQATISGWSEDLKRKMINSPIGLNNVIMMRVLLIIKTGIKGERSRKKKVYDM